MIKNLLLYSSSFLVLLTFTLLKPCVVKAQDANHYHGLPGPEAVGLGGAFTAIANSPAAAYYNPAGIVMAARGKASLSLSLYGFEYHELKGGLSLQKKSKNLERLDSLFMLRSIGFSSQLGKASKEGFRKIAVGIAFLYPHGHNKSLRDRLTSRSGSSLEQATYILERRNKTLLAGPMFARRFGSFSLGLSALWQSRSFSSLVNESRFQSVCSSSTSKDCKVFSSQQAANSIEGSFHGLNFRLGLFWKVASFWDLGFSASLSSIRMISSGTVLYSGHHINPKEKKGDLDLRFESQIKIHSPMPWSFRLGNAFSIGSSLKLSMDAVLFLPNKYKLIHSEQKLPTFLYPRLIQQSLVTNFHLGLSYQVWKYVEIRFGAYTNFSSAPDIPAFSNDPYLPKIDIYGASFGVGISDGNFVTHFGFAFAYGSGHGQRMLFSTKQRFEKMPMDRYYGHIYLAGVGGLMKFLSKKLRGWLLHKKKERK